MDNISLSQAWAHVAHSGSYWLWLGLAFLFFAGISFQAVKKYRTGDIDGRQLVFFVLITFAVFMFAMLFRPCEVAANTTVEQASRGVYIGY